MENSRVKRYSRKNRMKRRIESLGVKGILKLIGKKILENGFYLIVGFVYATYLLIKNFDNLIVKIFMKLPRLIRVITIYLLVINFGSTIYTTFNNDNSLKTVETVVATIKVENTPEEVVVEEVKEETCQFDSTSCKIVEQAKEIGLNEEQTLISIAISKWETGDYKSSAFINKNNVGGMMCSTGLITYDSLEDGINAFLKNLKKNYFDIGLDTLEKIQPKYCPIGADNDPNGLNQHWLRGTNQKLIELQGK